MLDYVLPQVGKLSRTLQTQSLDLSVIPSLVDASRSSLDDAVLPSANWVLELIDNHECLQEATGAVLQWQTSHCFRKRQASHSLVSWKRIFLVVLPPQVSLCQLWALLILERCQKQTHWSTSVWWTSNSYTSGTLWNRQTCWDIEWWKGSWGSYCYLRHHHRVENVSSATGKKAQRQHEFTVEKPDLTRTLFPNLCKIAQISLSIPVTTASVERSFSQMKLIKTRLCTV